MPSTPKCGSTIDCSRAPRRCQQRLPIRSESGVARSVEGVQGRAGAAAARPGDRFQFERIGYFCVDPDSRDRRARLQPHRVAQRRLGEDPAANAVRMALRTVFLDAGGVLVFPNWTRISDALARQGVSRRPARSAAADPMARKQIDDQSTVAVTNDSKRRLAVLRPDPHRCGRTALRRDRCGARRTPRVPP